MLEYSAHLRQGSLLAVAILTVGLSLACGGGKEAKISSMCSVSWQEATCNFTNTGEGPGIACVKVKLKSDTTGATLESEAVCSGTLAPGTSSGAQAYRFVGDVKAHCPKGVKDGCDMEIENLK